MAGLVVGRPQCSEARQGPGLMLGLILASWWSRLHLLLVPVWSVRTVTVYISRCTCVLWR